ncbi:MAG: hypothetical protein NXI02_03140 [Rhodobacteraceae bacterium]|nr:hypothetical protein [Paracoccaceae bacterium]
MTFSDPGKMRLFLLSLLWRAAATKLREFQEIELKASKLRRLKRFVREGTMPSLDFFPATLTQLSTIGMMHNLAPIAETKSSIEVLGVQLKEEPIFRFYFDGLVVHFYCSPSYSTLEGIAPMSVAANPETIIPTVSFEASWQLRNLEDTIAGSEADYPGGISRAEGGS